MRIPDHHRSFRAVEVHSSPLGGCNKTFRVNLGKDANIRRGKQISYVGFGFLKKEISCCYFFWGEGEVQWAMMILIMNDDVHPIVQNDHGVHDGNTMEDMMTSAKYAGSNNQTWCLKLQHDFVLQGRENFTRPKHTVNGSTLGVHVLITSNNTLFGIKFNATFAFCDQTKAWNPGTVPPKEWVSKLKSQRAGFNLKLADIVDEIFTHGWQLTYIKFCEWISVWKNNSCLEPCHQPAYKMGPYHL